MHKGALKAGALFAALAVILGAFGAHSIREKVSADALAVFETGVRYMMYHSFALLATGILYASFPYSCVRWAVKLFVTGIILFSGSLFLITYFKATGNVDMLKIGIVTPLGGAAFIAGWVCLTVAFFKKGSATNASL